MKAVPSSVQSKSLVHTPASRSPYPTKRSTGQLYFDDRRSGKQDIQDLRSNAHPLQLKKKKKKAGGYSTSLMKSDRPGFERIRISGYDQSSNPFAAIVQAGEGMKGGKYYELISNQTRFCDFYRADEPPHPTAVQCVNGTAINGGGYLGLKVDLKFNSSTGVYTDIWNMMEKESVSNAKNKTGLFALQGDFGSFNSDFMPIHQAKDDKHQMSKAYFKEMMDGQPHQASYGSYKADQLDVYKDISETDRVIGRSGYVIEREILGPAQNNGNVNFTLVTTKTASGTTVAGHTALAGPSAQTESRVQVAGNINANSVTIL